MCLIILLMPFSGIFFSIPVFYFAIIICAELASLYFTLIQEKGDITSIRAIAKIHGLIFIANKKILFSFRNFFVGNDQKPDERSIML